MPIGRKQTTPYVGSSYNRNPMASYVKQFLDLNTSIVNEGVGGADIIQEPQKVMRRTKEKAAWKKFFTENFLDSNSFGKDPLMDEYEIADQKAMMEQQFENDVSAMYEHAAQADYNPVIGLTFPMHKNILMNMVFDKGAIQKVVAETPKFTMSMEKRILVDTKGNRIDMFLDQNKMTDAIDASNPVHMIEITLPEYETTDVLAMCGGTRHDDLSIKTKVAQVKLEKVYIKEGDRKPDENGVIGPHSPIATHEDEKEEPEVWFEVDINFTPGYNQYERTFVQPLSFKVRKDADTVEVRKDTLTGTMDNNKFNIYGGGVVKAVRLAAQLDTANAMLDTCSVMWDHDDRIVEIPNAIPINTTISPEEVKDLAALYQVNQLTKIMSLFKTAMANYKDDHIKRYLDHSFDTIDERSKGEASFDFAPPEGYALDHVEWRYKTFFDFFDTQVTHMLQVLNDPNVVVTIFGCPDLIRKITPTEYSYQTPSNIGPVELDYKRTVVTSDSRVYQFIGSDKLRWEDQLIVILNPRNTDRIIYRIYDYQMYVSNEIRNINNPALPAVHAFERWLIDAYQPVQYRINILNRTGHRPAAEPKEKP